MITTLATIVWILAYLLPAGFAVRQVHDKIYRAYFNEQVRLNEARGKDNPSNTKYASDHANYPSLYATRRKWCARENYKMPAEWIIADYEQGNWGSWSPRMRNSVISVSLGLLWPISLSVMLMLFIHKHTLGNLLEPPTLKKQERQLDQSARLQEKAKETLKLADTFRNEDPSTFTLLRDTAVMMGKQADEMRKLKS